MTRSSQSEAVIASLSKTQNLRVLFSSNQPDSDSDNAGRPFLSLLKSLHTMPHYIPGQLRSRSVCGVSLLNAPASRSGPPRTDDSMDVDVCQNVTEGTCQRNGKDVMATPDVPFPGSEGLPTAQTGEMVRPRKRTRTTAILPPKATKIPKPSQQDRHPAKRARTHSSPLADAAAVLNAGNRPTLKVSTSPPKVATTTKPAVPTFGALGRRKPTAAEIQTLIYLYRSLLYGVRTRQLTNSNTASHRHDALLAARIKTYLVSIRVDDEVLRVDFGMIKKEVESTGEEFQYPHLHPYGRCSVLSYQQLAAMLTMRQRLTATRKVHNAKGTVRRNSALGSVLFAEVSLLSPSIGHILMGITGCELIV